MVNHVQIISKMY